MVVDHNFEAMGANCRVFLWGGAPTLAQALEQQIEELEALWSRFRLTSEVSWLNSRSGQTVTVSPATISLVRRAVTASQHTHGWFDPSLLANLERAGYDDDFRFLEPAETLIVRVDRRNATPTVRMHSWNSRCSEIRVNPTANTIWFPEGLMFDPGGIGKGMAADIAVELALSSGAESAMVDLGGDMRLGGVAPAEGWPVLLDDPFNPGRPIGMFNLPGGAVATSSKTKRRWQAAGATQHHLIDPSTGKPSQSDVVSATVLASECWWAECVAKAALLAGVTQGLALMDECEVSGVLVDEQGQAHYTKELTIQAAGQTSAGAKA